MNLMAALIIQGFVGQCEMYTFCTHRKNRLIYRDHAILPFKNQCKYQSAENPVIKRVSALSRTGRNLITE